VNHAPELKEPRLRFGDARRWLRTLKDSLVETLVSLAGDIVLLIDKDGVIRDVAGEADSVRELKDRVGQPWIDTVTVESRPKVEEMVAGRSSDRWRQVTQQQQGGDFPVRYLAVPLDGSGDMVAIGRDERGAAVLQQRLLQVQQSLERDYLALRQAESRYRLLFDMTAEPMLVVEAATRRIREINPAAKAAFNAPATVTGQPLAGFFAEADRERVIAFLGAAAAGAEVAPIRIALGKKRASLSARPFRQAGTAYLLLRVELPGGAAAAEPSLADMLDKMPDAFVLTDARLNILAANAAFAELVQGSSADQMRGRALGEFLGRPGIDLELILGQLREHGVARNVATILRGLDEAREEVEVSAVFAPEGNGHYGFSVRVVARRLRDLPPVSHDLPRSVEQLTELVGRMPLKDIVRESTDLIERQCIEAALNYTSNNRASAAEILGLSRQSLYSKLHRHGLVSSDISDD
jgi:transcriptional regulator PpsR